MKLNHEAKDGFMKVLITGATGFIGSAIMREFHQKNYDISILTRCPNAVKAEYLTVFEQLDAIPNNSAFDVIINLAGAPISQRWSRRYKKKLLESRLAVTQGLHDLVQRLDVTPKVLISASAIGYYGHQGERLVNEATVPTPEFAHTLCRRWEQAALQLEHMGTKVIILRLGVVLGKHGGILKKTVPIFSRCLGGPIGSGDQYFSWIHIFDVVQAINFLLKNNAEGVYNLTAPCPVTNAHWTKALAAALNKPACLPLPSFVVRILLGEMGESLMLHSQRVLPQKLLEAGFGFKYQTIESALSEIIPPQNKGNFYA